MLLSSLVGAGVSGIGSLVSGIRANKQAKNAESLINEQIEENDRWYNQNYNTDYLDTVEARSTLSTIREQNKKATDAVNNNIVSSNMSDEAKVAQASSLNKNYSNAVSSLAGYGTRRQDQITNTYNTRNDAYNNALYSISANKANAASALGDAFSAVGSGIITSDLFSGKTVF
ncbi:MAG: hypothetical protein R3Y26_05255 [Rikenellaceae bacterium]